MIKTEVLKHLLEIGESGRNVRIEKTAGGTMCKTGVSMTIRGKRSKKMTK